MRINIRLFSKHILNRALIFIALFVFFSELSNAQLVDLETRCLWIIRETLIEPTTIDTAFYYAYENGYDCVFVQVRGRGDAFYQSENVPMHPDIAIDFDPLDYARRLGHGLGLEVHAWVNSYILWSSDFKPDSSNHIYHTKTEWTEANIHGKMDWRIDLSQPQSPQWEGIYLSPTHPEVNPYLRTVFNEIIDNYAVDGLHLDYIRFQDDFYGYNPKGREVFNEKYNIDPQDIARGIISPRFGWEQTFVDSMDFAWDQFRRDAVTQLVKMLREDIENKGYDVELSAAVKPNINVAKTRWFQDWELWLETGLIDFAVPMNYFKDINYFNTCIDLMKNNLSLEDKDKIIMGIATYNQDAQSSADKVLLTRLNGFRGVSIFSYDSHKYNLDWFQPVNDALGYPFEY